MNSQIKISITIPILNEQDSIKNLLESLINQTYKADEIIFSDEGVGILYVSKNTPSAHVNL